MNSYLVFVNNKGDTRLIADSFNFKALLFAGLWVLYHRMFGLFVFVTSLQILGAYLASYFNPLFSILPALLLGFFAHDLLALKAQLEGYRFSGIVRSLNEELARQRLQSM